jgi:hypothetical protein
MSKSYTHFSMYLNTHITVKSSKVSTRITPHWVHIAIATLKRTLLGIHHRTNQENIQLYLDKFCYKLSRRYITDRLLNRLIIAAVGSYEHA